MNTDKQISYDVFQVTRTQMMVSRTPETLFSWVEGNRTELDTRPESRRIAYSTSNLSKKFYEEARPISLYTFKKYGNRQDVLITLNLNNENYDAKILIQGESSLFIEVTYAKDGHDEALRMELLLTQGVVSAVAPIEINKRKGRKRDICISSIEAVEHTHVVRNRISLVETRLEGKAGASYGRNYVLLVIFDDLIPSWSENDVVLLDLAVKEKIKNLYLNFSEIIIQGASGKLYLSYPIILNLK